MKPPGRRSLGAGAALDRVSAGTMAGLSRHQNQGPATLMNTAVPAAFAGFLGAGRSRTNPLAAGLVGRGHRSINELPHPPAPGGGNPGRRRAV
jgi:hypothetical protein